MLRQRVILIDPRKRYIKVAQKQHGLGLARATSESGAHRRVPGDQTDQLVLLAALPIY